MSPDEHCNAAQRPPALSFGPAADLYDSVRPTYPVEAVGWGLAPLGSGRWHLADIGAGTGIMTRVLLGLGHTVVAVEPDPGMRRRLLATTAATTAVEGSAESLPLPDAGIDGAVAAQAYHWFDRDRAHAELARVIRPGGVFAAIWNDRDESTGWVAEYSRIVDGHRPEGSGSHHRVTSFGAGFGPVQPATFRHGTRHTAQSLIDLMHSRSYYLTADPAGQHELDHRLVELTRTHPELAGRAEFDLPYVTAVYRAERI